MEVILHKELTQTLTEFTETDLKLNPDQFKIQEFHHDLICEFNSQNSGLFSHDFMIFFIALNSYHEFII